VEYIFLTLFALAHFVAILTVQLRHANRTSIVVVVVVVVVVIIIIIITTLF